MKYDSNYVKNMRNRTVRLDRKGDYWTDEERNELRQSFESGAGITEMAIRFQRTEPAIFQQIEKLDLYGRKSYPMRRKYPRQDPGCLCGECTLDPARCSMRKHCPKLMDEH